MKTYLIAAVVILAIVGVLCGFAMRRGKNAKAQPAAAVVRIEAPQTGDLVESVSAPGQYVAIMGASGSGKSTLMNILGCLVFGMFPAIKAVRTDPIEALCHE